MGAQSINRIEQFTDPDSATDSITKFLTARHAAESLLASHSMAQQFRALKEALNKPVSFERRRYGRIPLPMLLHVTPLDQTGQRLENLMTTVVGKDISPRGVSFFHQQPLPYRRALVTFEHPEVGHFAMEVDIGWCQFTEHGWYVSGARQMRAAGQRTARETSEDTQQIGGDRDSDAQ